MLFEEFIVGTAFNGVRSGHGQRTEQASEQYEVRQQRPVLDPLRNTPRKQEKSSWTCSSRIISLWKKSRAYQTPPK